MFIVETWALELHVVVGDEPVRHASPSVKKSQPADVSLSEA